MFCDEMQAAVADVVRAHQGQKFGPDSRPGRHPHSLTPCLNSEYLVSRAYRLDRIPLPNYRSRTAGTANLTFSHHD